MLRNIYLQLDIIKLAPMLRNIYLPTYNLMSLN